MERVRALAAADSAREAAELDAKLAAEDEEKLEQQREAEHKRAERERKRLAALEALKLSDPSLAVTATTKSSTSGANAKLR